MRLLQVQQDGALSLTEDLHGDDNVPAYAILSHTWQDGEEVTFDDLKQGAGKHKAGYDKIRFCAQQALRDGFRYIWVDTCCIDKSNSVELSEAINSMFVWYRDAIRCYVYLADVLSSASNRNPRYSWRWKREFKRSKWFSRGWTLQELLAPRNVIFYNREWEELGTKSRLAHWISKITAIDVGALEESKHSITERLESFSIAKRMSWVSQRKTTRVEDIAYCLLGIFNISMPLLYGEREKAFVRLQQEILKHRCDDSILAWGLYDQTRFHQLPNFETSSSHSPILASSPKDFEACGSLVCVSEPSSSFRMTNLGLEIQMPMIQIFLPSSRNACATPKPFTLWMGLLNCSSGINTELIGILLHLPTTWNDELRPLMTRVPILREDLSYNAVIVGTRVAMQSASRKIVITEDEAGWRPRGYFLGYRQIVLNQTHAFRQTGYDVRDAIGLNVAENRGLFGYSSTWDPEKQVLTIEGKLVSKDLLQFRFESLWTLPPIAFTIFLRTTRNRTIVRRGLSFSKEDLHRIYNLLDGACGEDLNETTITDSKNEPFRVVVTINEVVVYGWRMFEVNIDAKKVMSSASI